jgi:hypothetical protein
LNVLGANLYTEQRAIIIYAIVVVSTIPTKYVGGVLIFELK